MRALVLTDCGPRVVPDHPEPDRPGEALVAVRLAGVCATDLAIVRGDLPFRGVLGHEWVGEVLRSPVAAQVGRRVVGRITCPCGDCPTCRAGRDPHCPRRTTVGIEGRDGAFAERLSLPASCLDLVPEGVPDEAAVFAEPLAAALQVLEQVHVRPSDRVVVLGAGRLGQLVARVLALTGAAVTAVGRSPAKLALLPPEIARAHPSTLGRDVDLVVECTGDPGALALACGLVRPRGTVVLKTTAGGAVALPTTPWVVDEVAIVGSRCGPFAPALRLLASGRVDPLPLISARFGLSVEALACAASPGVSKVLIVPNAPSS